MTYTYLLLSIGCLLICGALVYVRQGRTAYAVVAAFVVALVAVHSAAGWPMRQMPPDKSTVLWIFAAYAWAVPPSTTEPRAYSIADPKILSEMRRQFFGRMDGEGNQDLSPMQLTYDKDGGFGVALLSRPAEEKK